MATVQHQLEQKAPTIKIVRISRKHFILSLLYLKLFKVAYTILSEWGRTLVVTWNDFHISIYVCVRVRK